MSKEDLIPLGKKGNEEHDKAVRAKLKGSSSDRRKIAQRISGLKRANPENVERKLLALISDPKISALEIMILIEEVKNSDVLNNMTKIQLINTAIKAHSIIFGTKTFNVNMELSPQSSKSITEVYLEVLNEQSKQSDNESNREGNIEDSSEGKER
ncbi:MAG: hypothetical protein AABY22_27865 [Nanoarchaeota archaeon]